jgi:hypothetical protein
MEKILYLKGKESFIVSIFLILFAIIAFVPFILLLLARSFFGALREFRNHAQIEVSKFVPGKLEKLYE